MKKCNFILSIIFILSISLHSAFGQTDLIGARSVVKIVTEYQTTDAKGKPAIGNGNGTGWCWNNRTTIVTALHVVAGIPDNKITVYTDENKKKSGAKVIKVYKEADLALLQLTTDLGLTPLGLETVSPNSTKGFSVWGFQHGVFQMGDAEVTLSRTLNSQPTLNGLINNTDLKFLLDSKQGYPLSRVKILRVSSPLRPGHSGAPIFTSTGKVIGMADGGLHEGIASLNWAIPASEYVPKLINSKDEIPKTRSITEDLKGSNTIVPVNTSEDEQNKLMEENAQANKLVNGSQSVSKTWTANYKTIIESLPESDKKETQDFIDTLSKMAQSAIDMNDRWYDVYEDFETGATFAIPAGEQLLVEEGKFYVSNPDKSLQFWAAPSHLEESFENIKKEIDSYQQKMLTDYRWVLAEPDKLEVDDDLESLSFQRTCMNQDDNNKIFYYHVELDGSDLLVVELLMDLSKMEDVEDIKQLVHYGVAAMFATFPVY